MPLSMQVCVCLWLDFIVFPLFATKVVVGDKETHAEEQYEEESQQLEIQDMIMD